MKTQINFSNQTNKTALAGQASTAVLVFENQTKPKTKAEAAGALKKLWGFIGRAQLQAFGLADLGYGGELGYISIVELLECGAELDLHWTPQTLAEVKRENEVESALNDFNSTSSIYHY